MAFLAPASLRSPVNVVFASSGRRSELPATTVKATASSGSDTSPHPIISSLRMAASAAVLLAATSPALACTPSAPPPPPAPVTAAVHPDEPIQDASRWFQELIVETAALARAGRAEAARARLSAAEGCESYARLLAAQALFVEGKLDEAIAAFEELALEDPADYRPLFCQSVLYLVQGREAEAKSMIERSREVGGDALFADPVTMVSEAGAEAGDAEKVEPQPAEVCVT